MFYAFFARKKLSMRPLSSRRRTFVHDPRLDGPITVDAFIAYMDDPPSISRTRMLLEERELHFELEGRMITFKDVECYGELLKEHKESAVWTFPGTTVHHYCDGAGGVGRRRAPGLGRSPRMLIDSKGPSLSRMSPAR